MSLSLFIKSLVSPFVSHNYLLLDHGTGGEQPGRGVTDLLWGRKQAAKLQLNAGGGAQNPTALHDPTAYWEGRGKWAHKEAACWMFTRWGCEFGWERVGVSRKEAVYKWQHGIEEYSLALLKP